MNKPNTVKFIEKHRKQYPFACKLILRHLSEWENDINSERLSPQFVADFHRAIADDITAEIEAQKSDSMMPVRFDEIPDGSYFFRYGKPYRKLNFERIDTNNCVNLETNKQERFKSDYLCYLKPQKYAQRES